MGGSTVSLEFALEFADCLAGGCSSSVCVRAEHTRPVGFLLFTLKCGVSAPTCVRVWAGESTFLSIVPLSFCLAYHQVREGAG